MQEIDHKALSETLMTRNALRFETDKAQLYTLEDCLSAEECTRLIEIIDAHLRPSTLTTEEKDKDFRTSQTCGLSKLKDPFIAQIDEKIAQTLGINLTYSEGIQAQKYEVGEQFKPHKDYFGPKTLPKYDKGRGNRTWTFMIYLNEVEEGGGTAFTEIGQTFSPKAGMAVVWNNLLPDGTPNPNTKHCGQPVERGEKYIITKWFREKGEGPVFYDDPL